MASSQDYVEYACDQMSGAGTISYKKMFGDYGFYCNGRIVGLICDNQVFIKPTSSGKKLLPNVLLLPPYKGAKPHLVLEELDDQAFLAKLISSTYDELSLPKPKKRKDSKHT